MLWSRRLACWLAVCTVGWFSPVQGADKEPVVAAGEQTVQWLTGGIERRRQIALEAIRWNTPHDATYTAALQTMIGQAASRRVSTPSQFRAVEVLAGSPLPAADAPLVGLLSNGGPNPPPRRWPESGTPRRRSRTTVCGMPSSAPWAISKGRRGWMP
jgi:hypothetical protein